LKKEHCTCDRFVLQNHMNWAKIADTVLVNYVIKTLWSYSDSKLEFGVQLRRNFASYCRFICDFTPT